MWNRLRSRQGSFLICFYWFDEVIIIFAGGWGEAVAWRGFIRKLASNGSYWWKRQFVSSKKLKPESIRNSRNSPIAAPAVMTYSRFEPHAIRQIRPIEKLWVVVATEEIRRHRRRLPAVNTLLAFRIEGVGGGRLKECKSGENDWLTWHKQAEINVFVLKFQKFTSVL
jgi:hypothetical protein